MSLDTKQSEYQEIKSQLTAAISNIIASGEVTEEQLSQITILGENYNTKKIDIKNDINKVQLAYVDEKNNYVQDQISDIVKALSEYGEEIHINKFSVEDLYADNANIKNLVAEKATIEQLEATNAIINNLKANELSVINADIENLKVNKASVDQLNATDANVSNLQANKANVTDLNAVKAQIGTLNAGEIIADKLHSHDANINNLTVNKANVADLTAANAEISNLKATKANVADLTASNAKITNLEAQVGSIDTLVNGNLSSDNIQSLVLTSDKVTVANGFIKNAMIDSLNANKINTGSINTNLVKLESSDGSMVLNGSLQQFKDKNGKVRIQQGKDAQGNFTFAIFDETGTGTLIDSTGIKAKAIGSGIIVNDMVSSTAGIQGSKLDINSVITSINGGTTQIKGTKIYLDEQAQTLQTAFSSLKTTTTNNTNSITSNTTSITAQQGQINQLISNTTITSTDGTVTQLKDAYNSTKNTVDSHTQTIGSLETSIGSVASKQSSLEQNLSGFKTTVSETYTTKTDFNNLSIGGTNLLAKSNDFSSSSGYYSATITKTYNVPVPEWGGKTGTRIVSSGGTNVIKTVKANSPSQYWPSTDYYTLTMLVKNNSTTTSAKFTSNGLTGLVTNDNTVAPGESKRIVITGAGKTTGAMQFNFLTTEIEDILDITVGYAKIEKGNKPTDWAPAPEDVDSKITSIDTRVSTAESKLTKDGLTTLIGNAYTTSTDIEGILTSKNYATQAQLTQTSTDITAKFSESGGYNLLYNGNFKRSFDKWTTTGTGWAYNSTSASPTGIRVYTTGALATTKTLSQAVVLDPNVSYYTLSGYVLISSSGADGTTNPLRRLYIAITWSDNTTTEYAVPESGVFDVWRKVSLSIPKVSAKSFKKATVYCYVRDTTKTMSFSNIQLEKGEIANDWTPNPNEVYDGITTIDKDGIKVEQSNISGYTQMDASGFYVYKGNEAVVSVTSSGAYFKGTVSISGGSISDSALSSNVTGAASRVTDWTTTGTTTINGGKITADSITATQIAARTITATQIAAGTVTANEIKSRTITADRIVANAITANEIAASTITATQIASNAITADKIATGAVTAGKISVNTLDAIVAKIGGFNIGSTSIYNGSSTLGGAAGVYIGTNGISCGTSFKVTSAGVLTATNANITGTITSSNATITGGSLKVGSTFTVTTGGVLTATGVDISGKLAITDGSIDLGSGNFKVLSNGNMKIGGSANEVIDGYDRAQFEVTSNGSMYSVSATATNVYTKITDGTFYCSDGSDDTTIKGGSIVTYNLGANIVGCRTGTKLILNGGISDVEVCEISGNPFFRPATTDVTRLGSSSLYWYQAWIKNGVTTSSDRTIKENIKYLSYDYLNTRAVKDLSISTKDCLDFITKDYLLATYNYIGENKRKISAVAQDVLYKDDGSESDIGSLVVDCEEAVEEGSILSMNQTQLLNVTIGAIQEMSKKILNLEERLSKYENIV